MTKPQATPGLSPAERAQRVALLSRKPAKNPAETSIGCFSRGIAERLAFALVAGRDGVKASLTQRGAYWYVGATK